MAFHPHPPVVAQTLVDSCWAAVLESWSRADPRVPRQTQGGLIPRWGEGPTGGITPATKIPQIAALLGLQWGAFRSMDLDGYIASHLPSSYVFCAYTRGAYTHAVLIYDRTANGMVSLMDPDGGRLRRHLMSWFLHHGPYVLMRKP